MDYEEDEINVPITLGVFRDKGMDNRIFNVRACMTVL